MNGNCVYWGFSVRQVIIDEMGMSSRNEEINEKIANIFPDHVDFKIYV